MISKTLTNTLLLGALSLASSPLFAAEDTNWFVEGRFGRTSNLLDDSSFGAHINAGYQFNPYFGVEAGYWNAGNFSFTNSLATPASHVKIDVDGWTAGVVGTLPLSDKWYADARFGALRWSADLKGTLEGESARISDNGTDYYAGVGLGYRITDTFGMSLNFDRYKIDSSHVNMVGLGAKLSF